jgi:hypothetical protein
MIVIRWNAISMDAEWPYSCAYPSGGGRLRDVLDSGGTRYEAVVRRRGPANTGEHVEDGFPSNI